MNFFAIFHDKMARFMSHYWNISAKSILNFTAAFLQTTPKLLPAKEKKKLRRKDFDILHPMLTRKVWL